jgi:hypothetical protein
MTTDSNSEKQPAEDASLEAMCEAMEILDLQLDLGWAKVPSNAKAFSLDDVSGDVLYISMPFFHIVYVFEAVLENINDTYFIPKTVESLRSVVDTAYRIRGEKQFNEMSEVDVDCIMSKDTFNKLLHVITALIENGTITQWMCHKDVLDEAERICQEVTSYSKPVRQFIYRFVEEWGHKYGLGNQVDELCALLTDYCDLVEAQVDPLQYLILKDPSADLYSEESHVSAYNSFTICIGNVQQFKFLLNDMRKTVGLERFAHIEGVLQDFMTYLPMFQEQQ